MTGTDSCPTATQVLVVGSGIAGLTAALRASRTAEVLLVTKGALADGATASAQLKPARLETGLVVQVPPFISNGDTVRVNTETGEYQSRV